MDDILLGSTFPLTLIRRRVAIEPSFLDELRQLVAAGAVVHSFWGHANTLKAATAILGFNPEPKENRPAVLLNMKNLPIFQDISFRECWVLSPEYVPGYRPPIGGEVSSDQIVGWQTLRITWL